MESLKNYVMESFKENDEVEKIDETKETEQIDEANITSDTQFTEYAETVLKNAHGDNYDETKAKASIDAILKGADGDYGVAVGMLQSSLG